jgi:hypothetical protein
MNLTLRLPDHLYRSVKAAAAESQRSMNEWMVRAAIFLLQQEHVGLDVPPPSPQEIVKELQERGDPPPPLAYPGLQKPGKGKAAVKPGNPAEALRMPKEQAIEMAKGLEGQGFKPTCTCTPAERRRPKGRLGPHKLGCPAE